jgi:hypothetical protein
MGELTQELAQRRRRVDPAEQPRQNMGVTLLVEVFGVDERIAPVIAAVAAIPASFLLTRRILTGRAIGSRTLRHRRRVERPN